MPGRFAVLGELFDVLLSEEPWRLSDGELDMLLEKAGRLGGRVAALRGRLIVEAQERGLAARVGAVDVASLLRDRLALASRESRRQVSLALAVGNGPCAATGEALARGEITVEHAHVIREAIEGLPRDVTDTERATAEQMLIDYAGTFDPYRLVRLAARIREQLTRVDTSPGGGDPTAASRDGQPDGPPTGGGNDNSGACDNGGAPRRSGRGDDDDRPSPDPAQVRGLTFT
ncbi:DUF222 domain-containing protein, partial [Frankia canadensis]|uniref:DUF222 domain-containing protein n=1 Tax=Frankia canadensis TaxID=1836972 RepID=UPI000E1EA1AA